jgi:drug/metabolite transporter (DMT)-like permease
MPGFVYLILCVLCTSSLLVGLKEVRRRNIDLLQATTFNYLVAVLVGAIDSPGFFKSMTVDHPSALPLSIALGCSFILFFFLMGVATRKLGMAWTAIMSKVALVLPALFSWAAYGDELGATRVVGLVLALAAVVLVNYQPKAKASDEAKGGMSMWGMLGFGLLLFLGNGMNDSMFRVFNHDHAGKVTDADFAIFIFLTAAVIGAVLVVFRWVTGKSPLQGKALLAGLLIGIPNYFSVTFLTKSLEFFSGTVFFPVNNIGILGVVSLAGIFFYKEKFSWINYIGLAAAAGSILLLL